MKLQAWRAALTALTLGANVAWARPIDLSLKAWTPVSFADIPPTHYAEENGGLSMQVERSASFLLQAFEQPLDVTSVSFRWRYRGGIKGQNSALEASKEGDDMLLRVGLLLAGPAPLVPFFAPAWVKAVRNHLSLSADRIVYLVVGAAHPPGSHWTSPYSDSLSYEAVASTLDSEGWYQARAVFPSRSVVGLWLMADGDNTQSSFQAFLRDLVLN